MKGEPLALLDIPNSSVQTGEVEILGLSQCALHKRFKSAGRAMCCPYQAQMDGLELYQKLCRPRQVQLLICGHIHQMHPTCQLAASQNPSKGNPF